MSMDILQKIVAEKKKEVAERKELTPVRRLEKSIFFEGPAVSMTRYIRRADKIGLIAEIKRQSPSKGVINANAPVERISIGYMQAGASGLSVLTDGPFFGGSLEDLTTARRYNYCPILRKDFVIDEYQVLEAKSAGADAILLIAAILSPQEVSGLAGLAHSLGMEVLLEVHDEEELRRSLMPGIDLLGVNNRNLATFETDIQVSQELAGLIPEDFVRVSESGIENPEVVADLMEHGFEGFLIGGYFMQFGRPERACREFVEEVKRLTAR